MHYVLFLHLLKQLREDSGQVLQCVPNNGFFHRFVFLSSPAFELLTYTTLFLNKFFFSEPVLQNILLSSKIRIYCANENNIMKTNVKRI